VAGDGAVGVRGVVVWVNDIIGGWVGGGESADAAGGGLEVEDGGGDVGAVGGDDEFETAAGDGVGEGRFLVAVLGMEMGMVEGLFVVCEESGLDEGERGAVCGEPFEGRAEGDRGWLKAWNPTERPFDGERNFRCCIIEQWS
jgi:hypothetical protein